MKKHIYSMLALMALATGATYAANEYGIPDNIQDCNILHCFDWTFNDIINELPNIAKAGFGAVQVSPVQGNAATNAEWFYAYMPYDFTFRANGNGSREQLRTLCRKADQYGIKIIVDVVANHINQASGYHDSWWDSNGRIRWNGQVNYGDRYSITHGQVGEYGDVNSEDSQVQQRAKAFIEDLKSLGVKGIRWDAAKHIGLPSESCDFWKTVTSVSGMWHYGETLDGTGGDTYRLLKEYTTYIGVTDTEYSKWTREEVCNGRVPFGHGSWTANGVPAEHIVLWGESHDDYSNDGKYGTNSAMISQDKIDRAWAIGACRNGESSLYFSRPSATSRSAIRMGQKGSTHFTSKEIAEVNKFRNAMTGTADYYTGDNGVACVTRQGGGAVIVVGAGGSRSVSVANGGGYVPAGTYQDRVSGNTFTVTASTITGQTGSPGIAVIYNGTVTPNPNPNPDPDPNPDPTPDPNAKYSVYLDNTANWDTPTVWAWNDSENCNANGTWPGDRMTKQSDGKWIWTAPDGKVPTQIIFSNNGTPQTADLVYKNGATYDCSGTVVSEGGNGGGNDPVEPGNLPEKLYVLGNLDIASWDTATGVEMTRSGYVYTATPVKFVALDANEYCYFNITSGLAPDWDTLNTQCDRYGAAAEGDVLEPEKPMSLQKYPAAVSASACKSWKVLPGEYRLTLDLKNNTITLHKSLGVTAIETDGEAPVYFNLQGMRVAAPMPGQIYIVVRGSRAERVVYRR